MSESWLLDVRNLRKQRGRRQRDLAREVGLTANQLMKIERGLVPIAEEVKERILHALDVDIRSLNTIPSLLRQAECGEGYATSRPESQSRRMPRKQPTANRKPVLDLFCGVGGFSAGFEQTAEFEVVAGVDLLGDRLDTFAVNHPTAHAFGQDIRSFSTHSLEEVCSRPFIVVGGPPCQGFSSIRPFRNAQWTDPRNNLAEEFCRIVCDLRPEWIVFENVVGLLTYQRGRTLRAIQDAFEAIGYRTDARVLNTASFGIPQRRERLILVGSAKKKSFKWPVPTHHHENRSMVGDSPLLIKSERDLFAPDLPRAVTVREALIDLPKLDAGKFSTRYADIEPTAFARYIRNGATTLTLHEATAHSLKMLEIIRHSGTNINALPAGMVTSGFSSCYSRLDGDEPSVTLTVNFVHPASNRCIHPDQDRALTPREGARLQGFFDTFNFEGTRAQVVKQIGNAVPPMLGKKIAEAILESD